MPKVEDFSVASPTTRSLGESFEIDYTVSDKGELGLKQVELWQTQEKDKWPRDPIQTKALASETGPLPGSFTDTPSAPGTYWYGVHVVDNAGNWNDQKNSNTNNEPGVYGPIEVEVMNDQLVTLTLYVHDGDANGPIIPDALVKGQDGSGNDFRETANDEGYVTISREPGTWSFSASADGYETNSWDQEISKTCTKHAFLQKESVTQSSENSVVGKWKFLFYCDSCGELGEPGTITTTINFNADGTVTYENGDTYYWEQHGNNIRWQHDPEYVGDTLKSWQCWFTHEGTITIDTMGGTAVCRRLPGAQEDIIGSWSAKRISDVDSGNRDEGVSDVQSAEDWFNKGKALYAQAKYGEAVTAFDKAIEIDPQHYGAWAKKADCLTAVGRDEEAIEAAERAIEIDPQDTGPWAYKACALRHLGRYEEALSAIDRAVEIDPNYGGGWYDKGTYLTLLGRTTEANAAFAKAKELGYNG